MVTLEQLRSVLGLAPMTIRRALQQHGYFSSFNHNSSYCTLAERPRFDANGLWFYRSIGFSCHRTLTSTLVALVQDAAAGATPEELAQLLLTSVSNLLASLARTTKNIPPTEFRSLEKFDPIAQSETVVPGRKTCWTSCFAPKEVVE